MDDGQKLYQLGVAVDVVIFTVHRGQLEVLLSLRPTEPFQGLWALPGGFVRPHESAEDAAERELALKAGVEGVFLEQLYTFTDPARDPRNRVIAIAYYALVSSDRLLDRGIRESRWFPLTVSPTGSVTIQSQEPIHLAFDHEEILRVAIQRIRGKLDYVPIGFQLLPEKFTLSDLQEVYEVILGYPIDKRNFRNKVLKSGLVRELEDYRTGAHRPARLYAFTEKTF